MEITTETVKKWLLQYQNTERALNAQIERLETLEARIGNVGSPKLDGMPRGPMMQDRIGATLARKEQLETRIRRMIEEQTDRREAIERYTSRLRKPEEAVILEMRYIDGEKWSEINRMLFGTKEDFEDREDSYLRRVTRIHGKALEHLAAIMTKDPPGDFSDEEGWNYERETTDIL